MSARTQDPAGSRSDLAGGEAAELLRDLEDLAGCSEAQRRQVARRGGWISTSDAALGGAVTGVPLVAASGVFAVIGRDGRPRDLFGPGRLRAPNATDTLWPLVPGRLLALPDDLLEVLDGRTTPGGGDRPTVDGPARWSMSLERIGRPPGLVVEADTPGAKVSRRLLDAGARAAAVTGVGRPAAVDGEQLRAASRGSVRDLAAVAPVVDAEAPVIEVLTALIAAGVPLAPLVSGDVPVGAIHLDELPLAVGPAARAACHRGQRTSADATAELAALGPELAGELLEAGAEASAIARTLTAITVKVVRCAVDQVVTGLGAPPAAFAWLGFGSLARGEVLPDSDLDTGLAWAARAGPDAPGWFTELATRTSAVLQELGYRLDPGGVSADQPEWRRDLDGWQLAIAGWTDPSHRHALIGAGVAADVVSVAGDLPADELIRAAIGQGIDTSAAMSSLAADAVRRAAPRTLGRRTAWRWEPVRRRVDLKRDIGAPIVELARMHTLRRAGTELATLERLAAAAVDGDLEPALAVALRDGFDLTMRLRLARSVAPGPWVAPEQLGRELAPAIRALGRAQRGLRLRHAVSR